MDGFFCSFGIENEVPPCGFNFGIVKLSFLALPGNLFSFGMINFFVGLLSVEATPYLTKGSGLTGRSKQHMKRK